MILMKVTDTFTPGTDDDKKGRGAWGEERNKEKNDPSSEEELAYLKNSTR